MRLSFSLASVTLALFVYATPLAEATAASAQNPTLDEVLRVVKNTLIKLAPVLTDKSLPELKSVTLSLKTATEQTKGGEIKIYVIALGSSNKSTAEQSLEITLSKNDLKESGEEMAPMSTRLAMTIREAFEALKKGGFDKDSRPLKISDLIYTTKFGVDYSKKGGVSTPTIELIPIPFSLSAGGEDKRGNAQVIKFQFAETKVESGSSK